MTAEFLTMKHEFGISAVYSDANIGLGRFARALFGRRTADGGFENIWRNARQSAVQICKRRDVRALLNAMEAIKKGGEKGMYPILVSLSKIAMLCDIATEGNQDRPLPPDRFITLNDGKWSETRLAEAYRPHRDLDFELIDNHNYIVGDLHVQEK